MTLTLHRDPTDGEHVLELPAWIRPSPHPLGRYWHQPRSANRRRADGELYVHTWCGQSRHHVRAFEMTDRPPPGARRCGTCVGRRLGYERSSGLIFTPRDPWALPAKCPGGAERVGNSCLSCGGRLRYYGWQGREACHRPQPELADRWSPCPHHGWLFMHAFEREQTLLCTGWRCPTREPSP